MAAPADPDERHAAVADDVPVDSTGVKLLTPRIVPLTSIRALSAAGATAAAAAAEGPNSTDNDASFTTSISRAERKEEFSRHSSVHPSGGALGHGRAAEVMGERKFEAGSQEDHKKRRGGGPCTTLVQHLGTVLGLRGKEAYRRPGPGKPVWRKRETLIQEKIVQYTTLDEEGAVQELFETEKSQTEVLHMECKRTGEFAHRESTHYESGETFNGEVGQHVTFAFFMSALQIQTSARSVDDEYEHLESTLPSRWRSGGAAGGVGGTPGAEGVESGPGANQNGEDNDTTVNEGRGFDDGGLRGDGGPGIGQAAGERLNGGAGDGGRSQHAGAERCSPRQRHQQQPNAPGGSQSHGEPASTTYVPLDQRAGMNDHDDDTDSSQRDAAHRDTAPGEDPAGILEQHPPAGASGVAPSLRAKGKRFISPSPYHYRSPSCSPRLSPRPARSPYRQEGVGARESSGRGESKRTSSHQGPAEEGASFSRGGVKDPGGSSSNSDDPGAARRERQEEGAARIGGVKHNDGMTAEETGEECWFSGDRPSQPTEEEGQAKSNDSGDSRTSTCPLASGGGGDVVDGLQPGLGCQNTSLVQNLEAGGDHLERPLRGDTSADALRKAGDDHVGAHRGTPVDFPGLGSECGGSVDFLDNQNHQGEGGREDGEFRGEKGWWQAQSGSALNEMEISFEGDNVSVLNVAGKEMNVPDEGKEGTPRSISSSNVLLGRNSDDADGEGDGNHDDDDDNGEEKANVSRLLEGLRSGDEAPPPAASQPEDKGGDGNHGRASTPLHVDTIGDGFPPPEDNGDRKQEPAAPAPFHSHTWGHTAAVAEATPATADAPCEDVGGGEGKAARADIVGRPGFPGPFSESDAVA
ncbi:unnamed protein product [Ectocarpus sp. CCAP 1310/34]|nr:unnamed protein product [Ectocarpus sp. CCAP 1310/34]